MTVKEEIIKISEDYFDYAASNYPVMCLSDEFYFFPRARKSAVFLNSLDSLDEEKIKQDIAYINNLKGSLEKIGSGDIDLETQIDSAILRQSMSTFSREFGDIKIWQIDPNLYLKILLLGIDQVLTRFSFIERGMDDSLLARIAQIPRLLNEAKKNLRKIPRAYLEVAVEMIDGSIDYFKTIAFPLKSKSTLLKKIEALTKKALQSLEDFRRFLIERPLYRGFIKDRQLLESILRNSFSYEKSLKEVFEIASDEYHQTRKRLTHIAKEIKPKESWQQILSAYRPEIKDTNSLLELYSSQIEGIKKFLKQKDVITIPETQKIQLKSTPRFMKPVRASASYSSPATDDSREPAYFYITADFADINRYPKKRIFDNIHNEYIFVTAHETYPGHHLLDSIRRRLKNPIRQQIESPLFYEGWASYSERLIDRIGYIKNPLQKLVGLKRQAWRAVRAMLDVGVRINKLKLGDAEALLKDLGYTPRIVKFMLRHYLLSPGYQLCYTIGKFEIDKLKEKFSSRFGLKKFHDILLQGGQIPFDLAEKRMQDLLCRKNF